MEQSFKFLLSTVGGVVSWLVGGWGVLMTVLLILNGIEFLSGMAADWGTLHDIKCDNMIDQFHKNKDKQKVIAKKKLGVLAVVSGNGWKGLYEKLHCDVISGGQSMNPSVQEISLGIENGHYEKYIVLPNNKNIILAAQQLQKMLGDKVNIIPSTNPM